MQRPWESVAYWLAQCTYRTQVHQPRGSTIHNGLGPPHQSVVKKVLYRLAHTQPYGCTLSIEGPYSCQVDINYPAQLARELRGEGARCLTWQAEYDLQNPRGGRREVTPASWPLYPHMRSSNILYLPLNKFNKAFLIKNVQRRYRGNITDAQITSSCAPLVLPFPDILCACSYVCTYVDIQTEFFLFNHLSGLFCPKHFNM